MHEDQITRYAVLYRKSGEAPRGRGGVKLEQPILLTEIGHKLLSDLAFEVNLLL
jgi:hypothetical protein